MKRLARSPSFIVGAAIIVFWVACAVAGPVIIPHDPYRDNLAHVLAAPS